MVELRLEAIEASLPKECYVSVRVGEVQKLSRLAASRSFKFPTNAKSRFGKIEIFRRIGAASVDLDPEITGDRDLSINIDEDSKYVDLRVAVGGNDGIVGDKPDPPSPAAAAGPEPTKTATKAKAAKEYLQKHSLEVRLSEAMQAVLRERPEDPLAFLAARLTREGAKAQARPAKAAPAPAPKEEAAPPVGASAPATAQPVSITPFGSYFQAHFTSAPQEAFAKLWARFPTASAAGPPAPAAKPNATPTTGPAPTSLSPFAGYHSSYFQTVPKEGLAKVYERFPTFVECQKKAAPAAVAAAAPASSGFAFRPSVAPSGADGRHETERVLTKALLELTGDLEGEYFPLLGSASWPLVPGGMSREEQENLRTRSLLFAPKEAGDASGRGVFVNTAMDVAAWLNEEDCAVRFMVLRSGVAAETALGRLERALGFALKQDGFELC